MSGQDQCHRPRGGRPASDDELGCINAALRGPRILRAWSCSSAELCGPGGPAVCLLDGAEDHRRAAPDGPAHQLPGAAPVMDPGGSPSGRDELAAGQHSGKHIRRRLERQAHHIGEPAFAALDDDTAVTPDQPAQHRVGVPGPVDNAVTTPLTEEADHDDGQASPFDAHLGCSPRA
jgi:hypothetical protein